MKMQNEDNLWQNVVTIKANKEQYLQGVPDKVTELKTGALLIQVANKDQVEKKIKS